MPRCQENPRNSTWWIIVYQAGFYLWRVLVSWGGTPSLVLVVSYDHVYDRGFLSQACKGFCFPLPWIYCTYIDLLQVCSWSYTNVSLCRSFINKGDTRKLCTSSAPRPFQGPRGRLGPIDLFRGKCFVLKRLTLGLTPNPAPRFNASLMILDDNATSLSRNCLTKGEGFSLCLLRVKESWDVRHWQIIASHRSTLSKGLSLLSPCLTSYIFQWILAMCNSFGRHSKNMGSKSLNIQSSQCFLGTR